MSEENKINTSNADRHPALRSSSVPSSCLRTNRDRTCRRASIARNVSFPADETRIVSGFLEPANPWEYAGNVSSEALLKEYVDSCLKHGVNPLPVVLEQIKKINFDLDRNEILDLKGSYLTVAHCEALEEIFKRVQFVVINVESTCLDDEAATSLFDVLEYYESATHLNMSDNHLIDARGWQACSRMIKKMRCLECLEARSVSLNEQLMPLLTRSLRVGSQLQVLKLENCHLSGRPFVILVSALKLNTNLKELFLGENYLDATDAAQIGSLLKCNNTLQFLDISNNIILDAGLKHIADGLSEQTGPGLNILVVWNNHLTLGAAQYVSVILTRSSSLEMLNVGQNSLTNDVIYVIKEALQQNHILLKLGMQSTLLTCEGAIALAEVIADNNTLQRIDLRDNNFQIAGLMALSLSMKENLTISQLDLDDTPRRCASESVLTEYKNLLDEIRTYTTRNKESETKLLSDQEFILEENVLDWKKNESDYPRLKLCNIDSRKISLTCETLMRHSVITQQLESSKSLLIEPSKTTGKLRSPLPSPVPSPVTSPSPTRSRFHVSKVSELSDSFTSTDSNTSSSLSPSSLFGGSRFKVTAVEPERPPVVISVPSKVNTTVGFECAVLTDKSDKSKSVEPKFNFPFKGNLPADSLDIAPMRFIKQPAVENSSVPLQRTRKISWVAPSSMFSFSQTQSSVDDPNKQPSSLDRLIGLFKSPFSQFQNKQQSTFSELSSGSQNVFNTPATVKENKTECNPTRDNLLASNEAEAVPAIGMKKCGGITYGSNETFSKESEKSFDGNTLSQGETLFPEEDDKIIITISEDVSENVQNSACVIGLSSTNFSDDAGSTNDFIPNMIPPIFVEENSCQKHATTDEISSLNEESGNGSTNFSCDVAWDGDVQTYQTKWNSSAAEEAKFFMSDLLNEIETTKLNDNLTSLSDNANSSSSSNQINNNDNDNNDNNDVFVKSIEDNCRLDVDSGIRVDVNAEKSSEVSRVHGMVLTQDKDDLASENLQDVDSSFNPSDSEMSKDIFRLSDINSKAVNSSDCNRLYLPCKLATWPQGLGVRLLGRTSYHMDDKYRCSSAPCLVEAATVVLFQRQLPSDLAVKIKELSPTKHDDNLETKTNLQMAS